MLEQSALKTIETIANTLVGMGRYKSQADAVRAIAVEQAEKKISLYERRIKRFQKKHRMNFEAYGRQLKNRATTKQEDEWMEWEAAQEMLAAWQRAKRALDS